MYVCSGCHRKVCAMQHVILTWASCELCQRTADCVDCFTGRPDPRDEKQRTPINKWLISLYRHVKQIEYPRKKT
jgi:hypothetical protein